MTKFQKNDTFEMPFLGLKKKKDAKIYQSFSIKINNHALFLQTNGRSVMYPEGYVPIKEQKQRIKDGKLRSQKIF